MFVSDSTKFPQIQEIAKSVGLVRNDGISYEDVRYGFGTPKGHFLVPESRRSISVILGNIWSTSEAYYFKRALKEGFLIFSPNIFLAFSSRDMTILYIFNLFF